MHVGGSMGSCVMCVCAYRCMLGCACLWLVYTFGVGAVGVALTNRYALPIRMADQISLTTSLVEQILLTASLDDEIFLTLSLDVSP